MWNSVVNIIVQAVSSCFSWFDQLMKAIPGAWNTVFSIVVILVISRFLLSPVLGSLFSRGSDRARRSDNNDKG